MPINTTYPNASNWSPLQAKTTNITAGGIKQKLTGFGVGAIGSLSGIPLVGQIGQSLIDANGTYSVKSAYAVASLSATKATNNIGTAIKFPDFRARKFGDNPAALFTKRLDGAAAAARTVFTKKTNGGGFQNSIRSAAYSAASITPFGPYALFNVGTTYGMGDHDNPYALRSDFTAQSHVATQWRGGAVDIKAIIPSTPLGTPGFEIFNQNPGSWAPTRNLVSKATPFRGDKVSVIDFSQRSLKDAYRWLPKPKIFGLDVPFGDAVGKTADFIKFFFTGPKLHAGTQEDDSVKDDIIVFRAIITSLGDSFSANWSSFKLIGRGDDNYQYGGYNRDLNVDFIVYATDRDEVKPIWRKLNALAGYTAPEYTNDNIALVAPWMRITIGDLFNQQPVILKSVSYTLMDGDTTYETNIEKDPQMMQVPHKIQVNLSLTPITDWLPQKGGKFYSLAKRHDGESGLPLPGNDNWLSDTRNNGQLSNEDLAKIHAKQQNKKARQTEKTNRQESNKTERAARKARRNQE